MDSLLCVQLVEGSEGKHGTHLSAQGGDQVLTDVIKIWKPEKNYKILPAGRKTHAKVNIGRAVGSHTE